MKAFVTGGHGFLGQHLIRYLKAAGYEVEAPSSKDCDLRYLANLDRYKDNFDLIYHLAAYTQAGDWCVKHPGEQWIVNQQINTNVLTWWFNNHQTTKIIAVGTSCSYAPGSNLVESEYMNGEPIESLYTYAMTKRMLLQGLRSLNIQYGMEYLYVIPATLYGPGYHTDNRQLHFIFDLIRKILRGRDLGETVILWGDGYQSREIVHVDDFILNMQNLLSLNKHEVYNLGSGEEFSIREFAQVICELSGYDASLVQYDVSKYVGARNKMLSISKINSEINAFASRDLKSGLKELIDWFEATKAHL
jgi:GDP-L-fucose synthase